MRGERKRERLREKRDRSRKRGLEWMEAAAARLSGFGGGVEWAGG